MKLLLLTLALACSSSAPPERTPRSIGDLGPVDALARRFGRVQRRMASRGYGRATALQRTFVARNHGAVFPLEPTPGVCTTTVALAGGSVSTLRMRLYDENGELISDDGLEGPGALVHSCQEGRTRSYLTLSTLQGSGAVVAAAFESASGAGEGFDGLFEGVVAPASPLEPVRRMLVEAAEALSARGLEPDGDAQFARLAQGQQARATLQLDERSCAVVVGRSDASLRDLDLHLYDRRGAEVARDLGVEEEPRLEFCSVDAWTGTLSAVAFAGAGTAGWSVWKRPLGDEGDDVETAPPARAAVGMASIEAALLERGFRPEGVRIEGSLAPRQSESYDLDLGAGCRWIVAAPDESLDLDLYLYDDDGVRLDRDVRVQPSARVGLCGAQRGVRIAVKGYGAGTFSMGVFAAPDGQQTLAELRRSEASAPLLARGFRASTDEEAPSTDVVRALSIESGCRGLAVGGSERIEDLDLIVEDGEGARLAADTGPAPWASATVCVERAQIVRFVVRSVRGEGPIAMQWLEGA
ncbi:MAG: hypothetical protein AAF938_25280 [Myxococcota bacterium]